MWDETLGLTGLILTKLDGSARGGSVVAVSRDLGLPVKLIGVGEGIEDLRDFEAESFVDGLLGIGLGKSAKTNEGAMLAARLTEMRKERDARAKVIKKQPPPKKTPVAAGATPSGGRPNKRSKNNKKKKRKKR